MRGRDLWRLSFENVFAAPVRTGLTILGMAIGIASVLSVLALGNAGKMQVRSEMRRLGIDKVWIASSETSALTSEDGQALSQTFGVQSAESVLFPSEITCDQAIRTATVLGCTKTYLSMSGISILNGRALHPLEWEAEGRGILLGRKLADELNAEVGETVELMGMPLHVRGIADAAEGFSRADIAEVAIVPLPILSEWTGGGIQEIMLQVPPETTPQTLAAKAEKMLKNRGKEQVETLTLQVQMEAADSVIHTFVDVLKWVAVICVLVGGIGVMNILLVSVRERKREIGIMKSLGTTHRQICMLFLLEALVYAASGGILGVVIGQMLTVIAGKSIGLQATASAGDCLAVLIAAMMIGLFFGVLPASRAAALNCVDALREE